MNHSISFNLPSSHVPVCSHFLSYTFISTNTRNITFDHTLPSIFGLLVFVVSLAMSNQLALGILCQRNRSYIELELLPKLCYIWGGKLPKWSTPVCKQSWNLDDVRVWDSVPINKFVYIGHWWYNSFLWICIPLNTYVCTRLVMVLFLYHRMLQIILMM